MIKFPVLAAAGLLACVLAPRPAAAWINTLSTSGLWSAYAATGSNNAAPICGVMTTGSQNRSVILKYTKGNARLTITLLKADWQIPTGTKLGVEMVVGTNTAWAATADGSASTATFGMPISQMKQFEQELRTSSRLRIAFKDGTEPYWEANLVGLNDELNVFGRCIRIMRNSEPAPVPTQPFTPAAATSAP